MRNISEMRICDLRILVPSQQSLIVFVVAAVLLSNVALNRVKASKSSQLLIQTDRGRTSGQKDQRANASASKRFSRLPLSFEPNQGQTDKRVKFLSHGAGYSLFLTADEAVLALRPSYAHDQKGNAATVADKQGWPHEQATTLRMRLIGANRKPRILALDELPGKSNYFLGSDPKKWRANVTNYARVKYCGVYPGTDLIYYSNGTQLEYDFILSPGANPDNIRLELRGAEKVEIDARGDLVLHTAGGVIQHRKPLIFQEARGLRREVEGRFIMKGPRLVGFRLSSYDPTQALTIDPAIVYSTYFGGSAGSYGADATGIATYTDQATGNVYVYVVGNTSEDTSGFPTKNALRSTGAAFLAKFNMAASGDASLVYSTFIGGGIVNNGYGIAFGDVRGIAVDSAGNSYITGATDSTDFPILKAFQPTLQGPIDAFVTELSADGSAIVFSTYLGGSSYDDVGGIAVDSLGNAYITGGTSSANFPVVNGYQMTPPVPLLNHFGNAYAAKIASPSGVNNASLVYSTYLGGSRDDTGQGIAVDTVGNVYVVGGTNSDNFPTFNAWQSGRVTDETSFVTKLNPSVSGIASLVYSTYLNGGASVRIAVDSSGNAYISGTCSHDLATTPGAFQTINRDDADGFVLKIDPSKAGAASLIYSTYLGGTSSFGGVYGDHPSGITVDSAGNVYVVGDTGSYDFPVVDAAQHSNSGVFQSVDGGSGWTVINDGLRSSTVTALGLDTSAVPPTLYAGTADGVFKSANGGLSWSAINNGLTNTNVQCLIISPTDPSTIYVGTVGNNNGGVFKTTNGGVSWSGVNNGLGSDAVSSCVPTDRCAGVIALAFDMTTTPATLYAKPQLSNNLYKSVNAGNSWQLLTTPIGDDYYPSGALAIDPKTTPGTIYVGGGGLFKSTDGGNSWTEILRPDSNIIMAVAVDIKTTPSTLYVQDYWEGVLRSTDGGNSFVSFYFSGLSPGNEAVIALDTTTNPSTILVGNRGGLYKSTDSGSNWTAILPAVYPNAIVIDSTSATATTPATIYAGLRFPTRDAFVTKINSTGSALLFSTYLGGVGTNYASGIALDSFGNIYVAGGTTSKNFPAVNAYQASHLGNDNFRGDAFVTKLGNSTLPSFSAGSATTQVIVPSGALELSFPNITGSTSGTEPTATVNPVDSTTTANLSLSNNLGAYEIKTTATYDTSGYATDPTKGIKIAFSVPTVNDLTVFNNLVVSHGEDSNGDSVIQPSEMIPYNGTVDSNKITYHDFTTRTVWVYVPSLSPFVIVKGVPDQFNDLIRLVKGFNLKAGIENSLDAKLQNALKAYQKALAKDRAGSCNLMGAFIHEVQAQTGKALTQSQALQLIAAANQIMAVLGCR